MNCLFREISSQRYAVFPAKQVFRHNFFLPDPFICARVSARVILRRRFAPPGPISPTPGRILTTYFPRAGLKPENWDNFAAVLNGNSKYN